MTPLKMLTVSFVLAFVTCFLAAQDPVEREAPQGANPFEFDAPAEAPRPAAAKKKDEKPEVVETDPHVLAIRDLNPQTPLDLMTAVQNLINLGRPDEAKRYLAKLVALNPDNATLWSLQDKFGSGFLVRLTFEEGMQPEGSAFADQVLRGSATYIRDPQRIDTLIRQLSDPDRQRRREAFVDLRYAGEDAAVALLLVWGDPQRASEYGVVREALKLFGRSAEGPLLGALESPNEAIRIRSLATLAELESPSALAILFRPALGDDSSPTLQRVAAAAVQRLHGELPSRSEAEQHLHREALAYFRGKLTGKPDHENLVGQWRWAQQQQRPVFERVPPRHASLRRASNLSQELVKLVPANHEYQKLHLTSLLESAKLTVGPQVSLHDGSPEILARAIAAGPGILEEVVDFALSTGHFAGAIGALEALAASADSNLVASSSGRPRPMVQALRHEDRRVRFAALQAIRKIDPREPFAGASFVPEAIATFARASGERKSLIGHPRVEMAQTLAGMLNELGVQTDKAAVGSQVVQMATEGSDYEFILVSDAIQRPGIRELLQQLRREPRTANIPIGLLVQKENAERIERLTDEDKLTIVFPFPADPTGASFLISRLLERVGGNWVSPDEKVYQAAESLDFMAELAAKPNVYGFYDLVSHQDAVEQAASNSRLLPQAARVLGLLATPEAQQVLVNLASQNTRAHKDRQTAAAAFDVAVQRRGVLLTKNEILTQYDRYNASETLDAETQKILGAVLDSIERPIQVSHP